MTTVTGLTADRMLAIEANCIVDAYLSGDNLVLVTEGGVAINVGSVRGPMGAITDSGWIDVTVNSPYVPQGTLQAPQVRKIGSMVYARGGIGNAGLAINATYGSVLTIPSGYRPPSGPTRGGAQVFSAGSSAGVSTAHWFVNPTGSVDIRVGGTLGSYYFWSGANWSVD